MATKVHRYRVKRKNFWANRLWDPDRRPRNEPHWPEVRLTVDPEDKSTWPPPHFEALDGGPLIPEPERSKYLRREKRRAKMRGDAEPRTLGEVGARTIGGPRPLGLPDKPTPSVSADDREPPKPEPRKDQDPVDKGSQIGGPRGKR